MKEENKEEAKKAGIPKYEYYIHYVGVPRRNDRWLPEANVRQDFEECKRLMEEIERKEREAKENEEFLPNNEHLGLSEKQVHEFEEATKVKTVEFIEFGKHRVESWYFSPFPRDVDRIIVLKHRRNRAYFCPETIGNFQTN